MIITQNGKAKVVVQDIHVYELSQESLAMLKILAQSSKHVHEGKVKPARKAFKDIKKRIKENTTK